MIFRQALKLGSLIFLVSVLSVGCRSVNVDTDYYISELPEPERHGVYHKINEGETLWRIAKTYGVAINDIIESNNIPNGAQIEKDQLVFIPGAYMTKTIALDLEQTQNDFIWPVQGKIADYFGQSDRYQSDGINIEVAVGTFVNAARTGRVVLADYIPGYGYTVILDHEDGFYSVYAHNSEILVKLDELVLKNKEIARIGTGDKRPFLHFQIRKNAVADNPLYYLP